MRVQPITEHIRNKFRTVDLSLDQIQQIMKLTSESRRLKKAVRKSHISLK